MSFDELVQAAGQVIEAAGVLAVLVGSIIVTVQALTRLVRHEAAAGSVRPAAALHGETLHRLDQLVRDLARDPVGETPFDEAPLER